jgi:hypothetical protein
MLPPLPPPPRPAIRVQGVRPHPRADCQQPQGRDQAAQEEETDPK